MEDSALILNDDLKQIIFDACGEKNWINVLKHLQKLFIVEINLGKAKPISSNEGDIQFLSNLLRIVATNNITTTLNVAKEIFRCLRNCVAFNNEMQDYVMADDSITNNLYKIFKQLAVEQYDYEPCLKMLLMCLTNLIVGNKPNAIKIWPIYNDELIKLLEKNILVAQTSALIYNLRNIISTDEPPSHNLVLSVLNALNAQNKSEFLLFLLEDFLIKNIMVDYHYLLKTDLRFIVLTEIKDGLEKGHSLLSNDYLKVILESFNNQTDIILKTMNFDDLQPINTKEFVLLVDLAAFCSADDKYKLILQEDRCLLINCIYFLKAMHSIGREKNNYFAPINTLAELETVGEDIKEHLYFGLKAKFIRIIGNLASGSKNNQNTIRELECIPILLDSCNIDAKNPYILQWSIFAIHNIVENNDENQEYIYSMKKNGTDAEEVERLEKLGIKMDYDGSNK